LGLFYVQKGFKEKLAYARNKHKGIYQKYISPIPFLSRNVAVFRGKMTSICTERVYMEKQIVPYPALLHKKGMGGKIYCQVPFCSI